MNILVTGGSGFIGSALVTKLRAEGHSVTVLDSGNRHGGEFQGDITCYEDVLDAMQDIDIVFHLASVNGTKSFYTKPYEVMEVNLQGTLNVIKAMKQSGSAYLFYASTSETYQSGYTVPTPEDTPLIVPDVLNPRFSYGGSKLACELLVLNSGLPKAVVFRPHNVYGPNMGFDHVIPELVLRLSKKPQMLELLGDGTATRSFCYIEDFIDQLMLVFQRAENRSIWHLGCEDEVQIRTVANKLMEKLGHFCPVGHNERPFGEVARRCPDVSKIRHLGWQQKFTLDEGLSKYVEWFNAR